MDERLLLTVLAALFVLITLVIIGFFAALFRPWIRGVTSGTPVSLISVVGMRLRGNPPGLLIDAYGTLRRVGVDATIADVELTYMDNKTRVRTSQDLVSLIKSKAAK